MKQFEAWRHTKPCIRVFTQGKWPRSLSSRTYSRTSKATLGRPVISILEAHADEEANFPLISPIQSTCAFLHFTNNVNFFSFKVFSPKFVYMPV